MRKKNGRKLNVTRETLAVLDAKTLDGIAVGAGPGLTTCPRESAVICSIQHTCVSCYPSHTCTEV